MPHLGSRNHRSDVGTGYALLAQMMGRILLIVCSLCVLTLAPSVARAELPRQAQEAPLNNGPKGQSSATQQRGQTQDAQSYAEREKQSPELEEFKGGDKVTISLGVGTLLVILIILIIL